MFVTNLLKWFIVCVAVATADVVETATKISFKENSGGLELAGVGARYKKIGPVGVKVYGVGAYFNTKAALKQISEYKSKKSDSKFFSALSNASFEKKIVLKMARTVGSETMAEALAESIRPRMSEDVEKVDQFQSILLKGLTSDGSAKKGTQFDFLSSFGKFTVAINGKKAGEIYSSSLCNAFIATYLDEKGVSPSLKNSISKTLCDKL